MDSIIIFCAKYLFLLVAAIGLLVWAQATKNKKVELAAAVILAAIVAFILSAIAGKLYYDPRPFVSRHVKALISHPADNGFPSGHTIYAVTVSTVIIYYRRNWGVLALVVSLLVGIGRVAAGVHSPIDIVGGFILGAMAGALGYWLARQLLDSKLSVKLAGGRRSDRKAR